MKKTLVLVLILTLFFSTLAIALLVKEGEADPFPPPTTEITIENPQNASYNENLIALNFSAESISFFSNLHFYYSIDGQERIPIENVTVVSEQFVPINPGIYIKNVTGNCVMGNMSEGWHNVTVYEISHINDDPQNEEIIYSASAQFNVVVTPEPQREPDSFPFVPVAAVSGVALAIFSIGLLTYLKKRNK